MAKTQTKINGIAEQMLAEIEIGLDIVVATPEDMERFKDSLTVVIGQALKEGTVIYDEAA